jgi:citrate/tricarballylate utilization protein
VQQLKPWREAHAVALTLARGARPCSAAEAEVARQMQICNACRYCEGFCAVFPAMTRRLEFGKADMHFPGQPVPQLRRLPARLPVRAAARVCGQRAAGHGAVRGQTYADYAWPPALGALYQRNGLTLALALAAGLALFLVLAAAPPGSCGGRPWAATSTPSSRTTCWWAVRAGVRFRGAGAGHGRAPLLARRVPPPAAPLAGRRRGRGHARRAALKYLDGGHGDGCHNEDDAYTLRAGAFTTSRSTASCCALPPPAWPRCTTTPWAGWRPTTAQPAQAAGRVGGISLLAGTAGCGG